MKRRETAQRLVDIAKNLTAAQTAFDDEARELIKALRRLKGVNSVEDAGFSSPGEVDMTLDMGEDEIHISIDRSGKVYWEDFTHKTYLGDVYEPRKVLKTLSTEMGDTDDFTDNRQYVLFLAGMRKYRGRYKGNGVVVFPSLGLRVNLSGNETKFIFSFGKAVWGRMWNAEDALKAVKAIDNLRRKVGSESM